MTTHRSTREYRSARQDAIVAFSLVLAIVGSLFLVMLLAPSPERGIQVVYACPAPTPTPTHPMYCCQKGEQEFGWDSNGENEDEYCDFDLHPEREQDCIDAAALSYTILYIWNGWMDDGGDGVHDYSPAEWDAMLHLWWQCTIASTVSENFATGFGDAHEVTGFEASDPCPLIFQDLNNNVIGRDLAEFFLGIIYCKTGAFQTVDNEQANADQTGCDTIYSL